MDDILSTRLNKINNYIPGINFYFFARAVLQAVLPFIPIVPARIIH